MKDLIRIKIKKNNTKIYYNKKEFSSRMEALEGCIEHLKKLKRHYYKIANLFKNNKNKELKESLSNKIKEQLKTFND